MNDYQENNGGNTMKTLAKKITAVFMSMVMCFITFSYEPNFLNEVTASTAGLVDGIYIMRQATSGKSINIAFGDMGNGARATIHDDVHQVELIRLEDSSYSVKIVYSQLYLDVQFAWTDNGNVVVQGPWHDGNTDNLRWYIVDHGSQGYELVAKHSGKALDVEGGNLFDNGVGLQQWERNNTPAQRWTFQLIEPTIKTYTVRFNANGGTGTMADQTFTVGVAQPLRPNTFTRTGYTFQGWANSTGAVEFKDNESVTNLSKTQGEVFNLYAQWKIITYIVTIDPANGTPKTTQPVDYGNKAKHPPDPVWGGHTFKGWNPDFSNPITGNTTISAIWDINIYTVANNVSNATLSPIGTIAHGMAYSGKLTQNTGYDLPSTISITVGGSNYTGFTYNSSTGAISISGSAVTGDIVISGTTTKKTYSITNNIANTMLAPLGANTATHGVAYSGTLSANDRYNRPVSISMTIDGKNYTNFTYTSSTGAISIPGSEVTGEIIISGEAKRSGFLLDLDGYSFSNKYEINSFGYPDEYVIPIQRYVNLFGELDGSKLYNLYSKYATARGKNCFGFSLTAGRFYKNDLKPSDYGANTVFEIKAPKTPDHKVTELIETFQILQYHDEVQKELCKRRNYPFGYTVSSLLDAVIAFQKNDGSPVVIILDPLPGVEASAHAVLAYKYEETNESEYSFWVYDSNSPSIERIIRMNFEEQSWRYSSEGADVVPGASSHASDSYRLYHITVDDVLKLISGNAKYESINISSTMENIEIYNSNGIRMDNGATDYRLIPIGGEYSGVTYRLPKDTYRVVTKSGSGNSFEITASNGETNISVSNSNPFEIRVDFDKGLSFDITGKIGTFDFSVTTIRDNINKDTLSAHQIGGNSISASFSQDKPLPTPNDIAIHYIGGTTNQYGINTFNFTLNNNKLSMLKSAILGEGNLTADMDVNGDGVVDVFDLALARQQAQTS